MDDYTTYCEWANDEMWDFAEKAHEENLLTEQLFETTELPF
jgi:hypothetical protein